MEQTLFIKTQFVYVCFWGLGILLLWFRPRIEIFWKIIATLILVLNIWFFYSEIQSGYNSLLGSWFMYILNFIKELAMLVFTSLFYLWPCCLILIFFKADDIGAEKLLKFLCLLTIFLWVAYNVYSYFDKGFDKLFYETLKKTFK